MVLEQLDVRMRKNKPRQRHHDFPKFTPKWIWINMEQKTISEENFAENPCDLESFNEFSQYNIKSMIHEKD